MHAGNESVQHDHGDVDVFGHCLPTALPAALILG